MDFQDPRIESLLNAWSEANRAKRYDEAEAAIGELFAWLAEQIEADPEFKYGWSFVASECEDNGDWEGAESAYREIIALEGNDWKALSDLSSLYQLLGRNDEAMEFSRRATLAARDFGVDTLLYMALLREARLQLEAGDLSAAEALIAETFEVLEKDEPTAQLLGAAMTLRAFCRLKRGELDAASKDLDDGFALLGPMMTMESAAGLYADVARWYSVKGRLEAMRGDSDSAVGAWAEAIRCARHVLELYDGEGLGVKAFLAKILKRAAESLEQFGPDERTAAMLDESREIWASLRLPAESW